MDDARSATGTGDAASPPSWLPDAPPSPARPSRRGARPSRPSSPGAVLLAGAAVALLAGALGAALAAGAVGAALRAARTTVVAFTPNRSIFPQMPDVPSVLRRVLPAVVAVRAVAPGCPADPFLGGTRVAEGSGMIVSGSGEILTNSHVIAGATGVTVTLPGEDVALSATVVGADPADDVALLRVRDPLPRPLPTVRLAGAAAIRVGEQVLAIGDALGLSPSTPSVTEGIVSAVGRTVVAGGPCEGSETLTDLLQTQAPINAGNSGGPLVDAAGAVVGMATADAESAPGNAPAQNIGFAIPSDDLRALLPALRSGGTIGPARAFLGVQVVSVTPALSAADGLATSAGALVTAVLPGSPAARAGLEPGDVIVAFAGEPVTTASGLSLLVGAARPGERVVVAFFREATVRHVALRLASAPVPVG
jgi:S1-C subfamily serine protease